MNVIIVGNFDVVERDIVPAFYYSGTWYDYFSGEEVEVMDSSAPLALKPGQFHIFTSKKLPTPEDDILNSIPETEDNIPEIFTLEQNYPNPFNPSTTINFQLAARADVEITIFDILGREVNSLLSDMRSPGRHSVVWNGTNTSGLRVGSGIYIYRIRAVSVNDIVFEQQRKMILIK